MPKEKFLTEKRSKRRKKTSMICERILAMKERIKMHCPIMISRENRSKEIQEKKNY
jgi:hypothetical protein